MKFNNCAAWAKGWYKMRQDPRDWWMDLIHCLNNDGYTINTREDVIRWIIHSFDTDTEFWKKEQHNFGIGFILEEMRKYKENAKYNNETIDDETCIVIIFRSLLMHKSKHVFDDGGYKPSEFVLPLTYHEMYYQEPKKWNNYTPYWEPAEMRCDVIDRINKSFDYLPDQETHEYSSTYNDIERDIMNKHWKSVYNNVPGIETTCKKYQVFGKDLIHRKSIKCNVVENFPDTEEDTIINLGVYSNCIDFYDNYQYTIYVSEKVIEHEDSDYKWTEIRYTVEKIEESSIYTLKSE